MSNVFKRWQKDPLCDGSYPDTYDEISRSMAEWRKAKYGRAPTDAEGISREFEKPDIFEALGKSLHRDRGTIFNTVQIEDGFANCIFSSPRSIELYKTVEEKDRFFLMDGTFRITPRGSFQQVLIIYGQYGSKVCGFSICIPNFSINITKHYIFSRFFHWPSSSCQGEQLKHIRVL